MVTHVDIADEDVETAIAALAGPLPPIEVSAA